MAADPPAQRQRYTPLGSRVLGWISATSGLLTSATALLLILTGHIEAVVPVAVLGAAVTGGTAVTVNIRIRR